MIFALLLLVGYFIAALIARAVALKDLCAICAAVSLTWMTLILAELLADISTDPIVLAVLMGGSVVGSMYYLGARLPREYQIFKLPFILTLFWAVHRFLSDFSGVEFREIALLAAVWVVYALVFLLYRKPGWKEAGNRLIECCKNW